MAVGPPAFIPPLPRLENQGLLSGKPDAQSPTDSWARQMINLLQSKILELEARVQALENP